MRRPHDFKREDCPVCRQFTDVEVQAVAIVLRALQGLALVSEVTIETAIRRLEAGARPTDATASSTTPGLPLEPARIACGEIQAMLTGEDPPLRRRLMEAHGWPPRERPGKPPQPMTAALTEDAGGATATLNLTTTFRGADLEHPRP